MRKILAVLALMLLYGQVWAGLIPLASGSAVKDSTKISAVDGTAFIDLGTAINVAQYAATGDVLFTITDSAGKKLTGYIKARAKESLGSDLMGAAGAFMDSTLWGRGGADGSQANIPQDSTLVFTAIPNGYSVFTGTNPLPVDADGRRYRATFRIRSIAANNIRFTLGTSGTGGYFSTAGWHTDDIRSAGAGRQVTIAASGEVTAVISNVAVQEIQSTETSDPSATGVTITSTRGGSTYNWTSQESGFDYNDASGYTYTIYKWTPYSLQNPTYQMSP